MKKYIATIIAVSTLLALAWGMNAQAATTGNGAVSFSVQATQELTAQAIDLGTLPAGTTTISPTPQPVSVRSNIAWKVTGIADGDFTGPGPVSLGISNLTMGGATMTKTGGSPVQIATGSATSDALTPQAIATTMTIPWASSNLVGKTLSATLTYTITP